ncbi:tetratricopeptide repeat protein [Bradyrhizobium cenepequi]
MCTHTIITSVASLALALVSLLVDAAQAQIVPAAPAVQELAPAKPIGKVVTATGSVTIERASAMVIQANVSGQIVQTKVGDIVYLGDVVQTGADGQVGINFADGSSFKLSSNARMALDEFVYDPNGKSNSTLFNVTNGTLTFVAGNVAKTGDMKVDTPVATMGIRGTTPHVEVSDDGTVKFSTLIEEGKSKLTKRLSPAASQDAKKGSYLTDIALCNGTDHASLEARVDGCTALIASGHGKTTALAIAYNNRGNAYAAKGDYGRAIQDFDQSIKLNPTYVRAFNNRGVAYLKKGEYDLAIKALDGAIQLNPSYGSAFANRARAYLKKHQYDRAARDYDEAIRLEPNLEAVWSGRCWTQAILGALEAALEDCNKALQLASNNAATYDSRGLIYLKMGKFDAAIDDYSSALQLDPKLASALYGRGLARLKTGDKAGSNADIAAAKTIQLKIGNDFTRYGVR